MKDKVIIFVIGLLAGAVLASGAFCIYISTNGSCNYNKMDGNNPPQMSMREKGQNPNHDNREFRGKSNNQRNNSRNENRKSVEKPNDKNIENN